MVDLPHKVRNIHKSFHVDSHCLSVAGCDLILLKSMAGGDSGVPQYNLSRVLGEFLIVSQTRAYF